MSSIKLRDMTYGEFHNMLVRKVMEMLEKEDSDQSPLVYFPIVHDRVESFLLVHWEKVWDSCRDLTMEEWESSGCFYIFQKEVLEDFSADFPVQREAKKSEA
ncbi:hypothetical protein [Alkalicoccus halolimnae]|uniref:Uncharacterized protein n=1 Tax=Alkalicoccus halolimnae TaxID=1667239 RepID=A0A5C7FK79_9BACI|nr:hypothetical protein [Alkalicoccus halolimnae]TXF86539.1 hypothetical protein FTX54_04745 [Alkalicoccus halolimnae]